MAGHTPGPWTSRFSEMGGYDCMTSAFVVNGDGVRVAALDLADYGQMACGDAPDDAVATANANASLIAAAPDLLEALKALVKAIHAQGLRLGPLTADAEDAIAKAEGR